MGPHVYSFTSIFFLAEAEAAVNRFFGGIFRRPTFNPVIPGTIPQAIQDAITNLINAIAAAFQNLG